MRLRTRLPAIFFTVHLIPVLVLGFHALQSGGATGGGGLVWMIMFIPDLPLAYVPGTIGMEAVTAMWTLILGEQPYIASMLAPGTFFGLFGGIQWALMGWIIAVIAEWLMGGRNPRPRPVDPLALGTARPPHSIPGADPGEPATFHPSMPRPASPPRPLRS
jgi:hypothetical protein